MCIDTSETKLNMLLFNYPFIHFTKNFCGLKYMLGFGVFFSSCLLDSILQLQKKVSA